MRLHFVVSSKLLISFIIPCLGVYLLAQQGCCVARLLDRAPIHQKDLLLGLLLSLYSNSSRVTHLFDRRLVLNDQGFLVVDVEDRAPWIINSRLKFIIFVFIEVRRRVLVPSCRLINCMIRIMNWQRSLLIWLYPWSHMSGINLFPIPKWTPLSSHR